MTPGDHGADAAAPLPPAPTHPERIVFLGTPEMAVTPLEALCDAGFDVAINDPFAGGHIVEHHGAPHLGVHALQVEIDRRCYLDRRGEPGRDFDRVARLLEQLAVELGRALLDRDLPAAAE